MNGVRSRVALELSAIGSVLQNRQLRRLEAAWAATSLAEWTFSIALSVYAFDKGGPAAVGVMGLLRVLPGAFTSPFAGILSDRRSPRSVLLFSTLCVALTMAVAAFIAFSSGPLAVVIGMAAVFALANSPFLPAESTLMPRLSRTPTELAAGNVTHAVMQNLGFLLASLSVGVILSLSETGAAFVMAALSALLAAALVAGIKEEDHHGDPLDSPDAQGIVADTLHGYRMILREPGLRLPSAALLLLALIEGASDVLIVLVALDLLGLPESSAGYMNASWAAASIIGGGLTAMLLTRRHMVAGIALGSALIGVGLALPASAAIEIAAFGGFALFGLGYTLIEAASHTLMHRLADEDSLGRIRGAFESAKLAAMATGAILVPAIADLIGLRSTLVIAALMLPAYIFLRLTRLRGLEIGAPLDEHEYELLRSNPIFAPLPIATLELLCHNLEPVDAPAGTVIITEGETGDHFYVIDSGEVDVFEGTVRRRSQGAGESFGEIALLREIPRTATVKATKDTRLLSLDRDTFIEAVTGHTRAHSTAHRVADDRLTGPGAPAS